MIADEQRENYSLKSRPQKLLKRKVSEQKSVQAVFSWLSFMVLSSAGLGLVLWEAASVSAIVHHPSPDQIQKAIDQGREGARNHTPPNRLCWRFGSGDDFRPYGFLMTKLSGVAVLSGHFALRGEQPSPEEIQRVLHDERLQVVVMMFGETPVFAQDSYLLLKQGERLIKPDRIGFMPGLPGSPHKREDLGFAQGCRLFSLWHL